MGGLRVPGRCANSSAGTQTVSGSKIAVRSAPTNSPHQVTPTGALDQAGLTGLQTGCHARGPGS